MDASTQFLKGYLLAATSNRVFIFGGDYIPVECVLGHARQSVARALGALVDEGYLTRSDAPAPVAPLLHTNAHRLYHLPAKTDNLKHAP
ncbi:MAG: hypothetical protein PVJ57_15615 [Phycisphaerae bacterium]